MTLLRFIAIALSWFLLATCAALADAGQVPTPNRGVMPDLGVLPIGSKLLTAKPFKATDCAPGKKESMADCSAVDVDGRRYAFFAQRLARVSVDDTARPNLMLLGGLTIGQDFDRAVGFIEHNYRVSLSRARAHDGRVVASSGFEFPSVNGSVYSVELVSTGDGKLGKVVQRIDF
jgi:hypothetical protein